MRKAFLVAVILLFAPTVRADEEYDELLGELHAAEIKYQNRVQQFQEEGGDSGLNDAFPKPTYIRKFRPRFEAYAEKHAGESAAIPALLWLATMPARLAVNGKDAEGGMGKALATLTEKHAADPNITDAMEKLRYSEMTLGKVALLDFYHAVAEKNHDQEARGWAQFNIAQLKYGTFQPGTKTEKAEAAKLFRSVIKDYPDTPMSKAAGPYVFEIEHLQVGMIAPDIEGKDLDGKTIKLSQYRGKVVLLDFWGFW